MSKSTSIPAASIFDTSARPADWNVVHEGELYEGPMFYRPRRLGAYGVALMWTPQGYAFSLLRNTFSDTLTRAELLALKGAIDKAVEAELNLY